MSQMTRGKLKIESAFLYDLASEGTRYSIDGINQTVTELDDDREILSRFTLYTKKTDVGTMNPLRVYGGLLLDHDFVIQQLLYGCSVVEQIKNLREDQLLVEVTAKQMEELQKIMQIFHNGDVIKFYYDRLRVSEDELRELGDDTKEAKPLMILNHPEMITMNKKQMELSGVIYTGSASEIHQVQVVQFGQSKKQKRSAVSVRYERSAGQGEFSTQIDLDEGVNYIDVIAWNTEEKSVCQKSLIVFYKEKQYKKQSILWVEQYVTAHLLNTTEKITKLLITAKNAGITAVSVDVKGCEGYASYKKAVDTKVPYLTASINPNKQITMEIDFLEEIVKEAHKLGLKVYASLNFFVEGNLKSKDFAIGLPYQHPEWAEVLQVPEDEGVLKSVLNTKRDCLLCYVNPANDEVSEFELLRVKEVIENYDVDGIVMDRTRYDNQYADFGNVTKVKFEKYLHRNGKELNDWPEDVYSVDSDGRMIFGSLYLEWLTFRAEMIRSFAEKLRHLIEKHNVEYKKQVCLAAYAGSWYELYYQNGVNWGSTNFCYNKRLKFPLEELYTQAYQNTSYLEFIDFLMIGCYYTSKDMIEKYLTIGNIVTNGEVPIIGSISLPHLTSKETQRVGYQTCFTKSDGCMIFDLCYVDWEKLVYAMRG